MFLSQVIMAITNVLLVLVALNGNIAVCATSPVVHTSWGNIEGINKQDEHGHKLEMYLGIPFAQPLPHPGVTGTYNASKHGPSCNQVAYRFGPTRAIGDEDCLSLNIYVPSENRTSFPRAVMVWIYGGSFMLGEASMYDPSPLATVDDVIAVTLQYRLGPFGFLSTLDNTAKGNYGLWDQILALKWIKKNIGGFGGDPDQVTIIGESAGAASVGFLTVSPETNGLFKRAILQSGSVTSPWAIKQEPIPIVSRISEQVGCGKVNRLSDHSVLSCLRKVPAENLTLASFFMEPLTPVVDGEIILADPQQLLSSPKLLLSSSFGSYDVMIGINNNEGAGVFLNSSEADAVRNSTRYKTSLLPRHFQKFYGGYNTDMIEAAVFEYMFPTPPDSDMFDLQPVFDTNTDANQLVPGVQYARAHASLNGTGHTYFYYFDHDPKMTLPKEETWSLGMHHGYDLYYTFGFNDVIVKAMASASNFSAEIPVSVAFRKILTQFSKLGDPNPAVRGDTSETWAQFDLNSETYLDFDDHVTVRHHVAQRTVALWLDLLPRLRNIYRRPGNSISTQFPQIIG